MDAAGWSALGTWASVVIYIVILVYAIKQVREAKKLRRAQIRPFVIVDFEPGFIVYIVVENIGTTLARNVKISFSPKPEATVQQPWDFEEAPLLRDGVQSFPPGKRHRIFFDALNDRLSTTLPMEYEAKVSYEDDEGNRYQDVYTLNLNAMLHTALPERSLPDLVNEMQEIRKQLTRWTDFGGGLLVHARDKDEMLRKEHERVQARIRERADTAGSPDGDGGTAG